MTPELRTTGISVVGDVPWGTHFCTFYQTKQDLLDILVPFFKAGLEGNEFCLWIISNSELLTKKEAISALQEAVPNLNRHLFQNQIEIVGHDQWFLEGGAFELSRVAHRFKEKLNAALAKGHAGMRVNGSPAWLYKEEDNGLITFEEEIQELFRDLRLIASCTYPISESNAAELLDVAHAHEFVVTRRHGKWEEFETPELKQAKAEIKRLNDELEQRVMDRTRELAATNEALQREVIRREKTETSAAQILEKMSDAFVALDREWRYTYVNRAAEHLTQRRREDMLGRTMWELFPEVFGGSALPRAMEENVTVHVEEYYAPLDMWIEGTVYPSADGITVFCRDITARKKSEEALRASEARLQAAVNAADIGLWDWDLISGQILWLGRHEKLFGFAPGQFDGSYSSFEKHVHPEDLEELRRIVQRARDERSEYVHEYRLTWPDGSIHWISDRGRVVYDDAGQPRRIYVAVLDITERKLAEDRIRLIIDTIPAMVWSLGPDGTVDFLNQRWIDYAGLSLEQYVLSPTGPLHPEETSTIMEHWLAQKVLGEGYEDELRLRRADGEYRWFLVRTAPLRDESGTVIKWYGVATEIHELKKAEEKLRMTSQELRALSANLESAREEESTRIAREIHDELGGALTSLRWDLEEVGDAISQSTDSAQLPILRQRIEAMMTLTEATLDTVRRLSSELRPMVLDELGLVEALEWQALQFERRTGIAVQFECSVEKIDLNSGESTAVFRILQEALTNILRHAQATIVTITVMQEHGDFFLTVKDNGKGITEKQKSDARSLGLLGMRERAHLIGAAIDVAGMEGQGTLVTLRVSIRGSRR